MARVDEYVQMPDRPIDSPFLMSISEVYSIQGRGTVVTGKIETGKIMMGDDLEIVGAKVFKTVCTGLEMYKKFLDEAVAGENIGVLVRSIKKEEVKRGYVLAKPGSIEAIEVFRARAYFLTSDEGGRSKPFFETYMPQFFFRTANVTGSLEFEEGNQVVLPGETVTFKVTLLEKVALTKGVRFAMREGTITLGTGIILDVESSNSK